MLLHPATWAPANESATVLEHRPLGRSGTMSAETHACALELATDPHARIGDAARQLRDMRAELSGLVRELGLRAAAAGTHPTVRFDEIEVSEGARYQSLLSSLRELARREPTFALHVHVGVEDPERAIKLLNRMRSHLPLLLALSANSPFWQGRDARLASARIPIFDAFPRVGPPRTFADYADYVAAVDGLLRADVIPEPTFLWWDVRPQPRLGTIEIRIMDSQTQHERAAALAALVQALAHLELEESRRPHQPELSSRDARREPLSRLSRRDGGGADRPDARAGVHRPRISSGRCSPGSATTRPSSAASDALARCAEIAFDGGADRAAARRSGPRTAGAAPAARRRVRDRLACRPSRRPRPRAAPGPGPAFPRPRPRDPGRALSLADRTGLRAAPPHADDDDRHQDRDGQGDRRADADVGDDTGRGMAPEVAGEPEREAPGDGAERVPHEEAADRHVVDPGQPGGGDPHEGDPAPEEHGLVAVLGVEAVAGGDRGDPVVLERPRRGERRRARSSGRASSRCCRR